MQTAVKIYVSATCPYCMWARQLLNNKGVTYTVFQVDQDDNLRMEMEDLSGRYTVPQIFVGDVHVGGYDDMAALDVRGGLDPLLNGEAAQAC